MAIYSFWIYDRHCNCIYSREYGTSASETVKASSRSTPKRLSSAHFSNNPMENAPSATISSHSTLNSSVSTLSGQRKTSSSSNNPKIQELIQKGSVNTQNNNNMSKLLFGTLFSLKKIAVSLCTPPAETAQEEEFYVSNLNNFNKLRSFQTLNYKCHFYETINGLRFVVVTDPNARDLQTSLVDIYQHIYMDNVVRNPLMPVEFREGEVISNDRFVLAIDDYWSSIPEFVN
ncbi:hypothetical protein OGAPHI_000136 [Ogataea philodendri]|uniref:Trafficking protein particle complex subunit n=1 Tax=Ogataea philodendri TaxID=1378263 RepID=A0A9P8PI50_9ASCO|nr:uncharacterized protein OGAPHI_000136 [Ogataea philodendri]KAH3671950.1 hypothetical protein OGAPHI_000136 [Ogataea philodendri]